MSYSPHSSVGIRPFLKQVLSMLPVMFGQAKGRSATAIFQALLTQFFGFLAPPGKVQSGLVAFFQALALRDVSRYSKLIGGCPTWTEIRGACPQIACGFSHTLSITGLCLFISA